MSSKLTIKNSNQETITSLESANRQLLENQSFLHDENEKLHVQVEKLTEQLDSVRQSNVNSNVLEALIQEKNNLTQINEALNNKIKKLKSPTASLTKSEIKKQQKEQQELYQCINELDVVLQNVKARPETLELQVPKESTLAELTSVLTKRLEEEQQRSDELQETVKKLRDDDQKAMLKDKLVDLKHLITDLEIENSKLKTETLELTDDIERYKKLNLESSEQVETLRKERRQLENDKDELKQRISDVEHDNLRLKKEMIEELNEANRAKRVSVDTEIALQHVSEAYEQKRKEVTLLEKQVEEAHEMIKMLKH